MAFTFWGTEILGNHDIGGGNTWRPRFLGVETPGDHFWGQNHLVPTFLGLKKLDTYVFGW